MKAKPLTTLFFFLTLFTSVHAQDSLGINNCLVCKNNLHPGAKPYTFSWKNEAPYIGTAAGLVVTGIVVDLTNPVKPFSLQELNLLNRNDVNAFDRNATFNWSPGSSTASDVLLIGSVISPVLLLTTSQTRADFGWLLLMGWEVLSINYGMMTTVKNLTNRPRPYVYNPDTPTDVRTGTDSKESFYSGHVSTTASMSFFLATVLTDYHPDMKTGLKITVWTLAAAYPAITAYLRVEAGKHYPTDVIAGYAIGALTGWLVPFLHKKRKPDAKFSFAPTTIYGNAGIYLSYQF